MRLLHTIEDSVLWLRAGSETVTENLRREAQARGVDPQRLIFAPFVADPGDHLRRLALADLFLDTLPYNAHATASDALMAGVPVLSCTGETFASRVGMSLLNAAGLPELAVSSLGDYEALASKLARDPDSLAALRGRLAAASSLFDVKQFTADLEALYKNMRLLHQIGEPPQTFALPDRGRA
jgi:predicted O-linked N-acetylglucosamine transferase (SPINDLY family)